MTGLDIEELVRFRAYEIWTAEGQPEGREEEHWKQARRELERNASEPARDIDDHRTLRPRFAI